MKTYPRIHNCTRVKKHKPVNRACQHCGEPTKYIVYVEFSYMRGDDECYYLCADAKVLAEEGEWNQLFNAIDKQAGV